MGNTNIPSFWRKYILADDLQRMKLLETLPLRTTDGFIQHFTHTTLKSYLDDLLETLKADNQYFIVNQPTKNDGFQWI